MHRGWLALAIVLVTAPAHAAMVCINGPSSYGGHVDSAAVDAVIGLRPACVRLPFRQDVWTTIGDPAALAVYDALVQRYLDAGIEVYGLVTSETAGIAADAPRTTAGLDAYASAFVTVVGHFKDRVRTYEMDNEPNNWIAPSMPALDEASFARLMTRIHRDVRGAHAGDPCWQVALISGALFAFDQGPGGSANDASSYLDNTYAAGFANEGWTASSVPFDGIGYHLYLPVAASSSTQSEIGRYLDAIAAVVAAREGSASAKQFWISEFGWESDGTASGDATQAREMSAAYTALLGDSRVAMAMWFTDQDFVTTRLERWGVYRDTGFSDADARPSRDTFRSIADANPPVHGAHLQWVSPPAVMLAGSYATVTLHATNAGTAVWGDGWRLGAGPGCPLTPRANEFVWGGFAGGGYANSRTDARVFLGTGVAVAPGSTHDFVWQVMAPTAPGTAHVVARMVEEGVTWFGPTADLAVSIVLPGDSGVAVDAGDASVTDVAMDARSMDAGSDAAMVTSDVARSGRDAGGEGSGGTARGGCGCRAPIGARPFGSVSWLLLTVAIASRRMRRSNNTQATVALPLPR